MQPTGKNNTLFFEEMADTKQTEHIVDEYPPEEDKMEEIEEEEEEEKEEKEPTAAAAKTVKRKTSNAQPAKKKETAKQAKTAPAGEEKPDKKQSRKELSKTVSTPGTIAKADKKDRTASDEKTANHLPIVASTKAIQMTGAKGSSGGAGDALREYIAGYIETAVSMALKAVPEDKKTLKAVHLETALSLNE